MASSRIVGFNTESVTSLVDIGTLILKSRESQCGTLTDQDREQALFRRWIPITDEDLPYSEHPVILTWSVLWRLWYSSNFRFNYAPKWTVWSLNFQKFSGEGLTEPLPQTPPPAMSRASPSVRASPSILGRFAPSFAHPKYFPLGEKVVPPQWDSLDPPLPQLTTTYICRGYRMSSWTL